MSESPASRIPDTRIRISHSVSDLPEDVVLSVRGVSKKFCRNLRRSMWYGIQDLAGNLLGRRAEGGKLKAEGAPDKKLQVSGFIPHPFLAVSSAHDGAGERDPER